jgi:hypothetical protein
MAFNPFHQFRRYNKVIFAILAIICMFTFVLSSGMGGGDLFTQIGNWLSGGRSEQSIISVAGKNYDAREVDQIRLKRMIASDFMDMSIQQSQAALMKRIEEGMAKLDPSSRQIINQVMQAKMLAQFIPQYAQQYEQTIRNAPMYMSFLSNMAATAQKENKTDDVATINAVSRVLMQDFQRMRMGRQPNDSYFGGVVRNLDLDAIADYLLWLKQADQLEIVLNQQDISQEIADETGGITAEAGMAIDRALRERYSGYSPEALTAALGDEFRARMAQDALMGSALKTRTGPPYQLTPNEEWDLFKDARTTIRAGLITLPVDSFLGQVTSKPTEDELKKLYDKYKNEEPIPYLERPGFKEPRKIQVEWVNGKPDSEFYKKAARDLLPVFANLRLLGLSNPAEAGIVPLALDFELYRARWEYESRESAWSDMYFPRVHDTSVVNPQNLKLLVGATVAALGTGAPVFSGPLAFEGGIVFTEELERAKLGMAMIGFGASDGYGATAAALALTPSPLGIDVLRQPLRDKTSATLAAALMDADLIAFRKKVAELGKEKDKSALRKTVDEFIAQRGMFRGATTELRNRFNLVDDAGLVRLKDAYLKAHGSQDPLGMGFGADFFADPAQFTPAGQTPGPITYNPREFPAPADDGKFVFWLTEDRPARVPKFDAARSLVETAWRRSKARDKAKEAADKLLVMVKQAQGDVPKLRDLAVQNGDRNFFELGPMAKRMPVPSPVAGAAKQYQFPTIPQEKIAFPSEELMNGLLDLRKQPRGAAVVLSDLPKDNFYVTSLIFRDEPTQDEFRRSYQGSMAKAIDRDNLLPELSMEGRMKYRREMLKQLREQAKVFVKKQEKATNDNAPAPTPLSSEPPSPID